MAYNLLADLVVLFHFLFVLFSLLGALLVIRWRKMMWLHLPAAFWAAGIEFSGKICPLTPLERRLYRALSDGAALSVRADTERPDYFGDDRCGNQRRDLWISVFFYEKEISEIVDFIHTLLREEGFERNSGYTQ
jgi:hypothetical protein